MKRIKFFLHRYFLLLAAVFLAGCSEVNNDDSASTFAVEGVFDAGKAVKEGRLVPLVGEWEIRRDRLLEPVEFGGGTKEFFSIGRTAAAGGAYKNFGAATFRLTIETAEPNSVFGVITDNLHGASRLWLNGSLVLEAGRPSLEPSELRTRVLGGVGCYGTSDSAGKIEVVFQTADKEFRDWNMTTRALTFGTQAVVSNRILRSTAVRLFVLGGILFIFLHHFLLFLQERKDRYNLFFSLFVLILGLRLLLVDDLRLVYSLLSISSSGYSRLAGIFVFPLLPLFMGFLVLFFPGEGSRRTAVLFGTLSAVFLVLSAAVPRDYLGAVNFWYSPIAAAGGLYIVKVFVAACLRRRKNAYLLLFAVLALGAAALHDLSMSQAVSPFRDSFTVFGILFFMLLHSLVIHRRYSDVLMKVERLTTELERNRDDLERMVEKRTRQLKRANKKLEALAHRDGLTKLYNRRFFDVHLQDEWRRLSRNEKPLSLMLADVDYFKAYNDRYGHQRGDEGLKKIASIIQAHAKRPGDAAVRYGGEEFILILPETDLGGARHIAESIRLEVEALEEEHGDSPFKKLTLSAGVASCVPKRSVSPKVLVGQADEALYMAKHKGRNRVLPE